jgi:hypothetical protein
VQTIAIKNKTLVYAVCVCYTYIAN